MTAGWPVDRGALRGADRHPADGRGAADPPAGRWLDRRSAPVAASQLLAWAIATTTAASDTPLEVALAHALHYDARDPDNPMFELPEDIPPAPATNTAADPEMLRRRVRHAINVLEAQRVPRQPKLEGASVAP